MKQLKIKSSSDDFKQLKNEFLSSSLLAVGETHGIVENLMLYLELIKKLEIKTLALEVHKYYETYVHELFFGEDSSKVKAETIEDGRLSMEFADFAKIARKDINKIILFDSSEAGMTWNQRDASYFESFRKDFEPHVPTLLIAGNLHTRKQPFEHEGVKGSLKPMGMHIKENLGEFPTIKLNYLSGSFYNFGVKNFQNNTSRLKSGPAYLESLEKYSYRITLPVAHPITL